MHRSLLPGILVLVLSAFVALSGCGQQTSAPPPSASTSAAPAPSSPAASPAAKPPASSPAASSASPAAKPAANDDAIRKELYEAAKKEGMVVYYAGSGTAGTLKTVVPIFNKMYPEIEVRSLEGSGSSAYSRITMEASSGQFVGDLVSSGTTTMGSLKADGLLLDWKPPNAQFVDQRLYEQAKVGTPVYVNVYGLLINTSLVKQGELASWMDLLDPKWKGRLLTRNPAIAGAGSTVFLSTHLTFGPEYNVKLAAQKPMILDDSRAAEASLARGEMAVLVGGEQKATVFQEGSPLNWILPKEGVSFTPISASVLKNAPHPNAAKLFFDFLLSEEVQVIMEREDERVPSRKGVAKQPNLRLENMSFLKMASEEDQNNMKDKWFPLAKQIYDLR